MVSSILASLFHKALEASIFDNWKWVETLRHPTNNFSPFIPISVSLIISSRWDILSFCFAMLCVAIFDFTPTSLLEGGFNCASLSETSYWLVCILNISEICNSFNGGCTPKRFSMFTKIAGWASIFLVQETTNLLLAAGGCTMEYMALASVNIFDVRCVFEECIDWWGPFVLKPLCVC